MNRLITAAAGGLLALFSMYWDDSLHTDVGRDTFWSAPHVLLYGSLTVTLGATAWWAVGRIRGRGLRAAAADPLLRWAAISAGAIGISAPADEAWHIAFGRDAVLWSPPHLLAIVATFALAVTLLRAIAAEGGGGSLMLGGGLVLAASLAPVMEYESDVPQYSAVWFLPAATTGITLAIVLIRRFDPNPWAVTRAALVVTAVRLAVIPVLAGLGYSTPIVPPVLLVALAVDLARGRNGSWSPWWLALIVPLAVHATYMPLLPVLPHGTIVDAHQFVPSLLVSIGGSALVILTAEGLPRPGLPVIRAAGLTVAALTLALPLPLLSAGRAAAHDPGQGTEAGKAHWRTSVQGSRIDVRVTPEPGASGRASLVARRAGQELTAPLETFENGVYRGDITVPEPGRWFVYAAFRGTGTSTTETWIPVEADSSQILQEARPLYIPPAPRKDGAGRTAATVALYGLSAAILLAVARSGRRTPLPQG
ncbi:hypothetical protein GCM10019016_079870 [Streptomyces prasinosporus]|uniref:Integral membrane protein n=2 Tax=Streptomyces TaxID=1883 RepID=A0ABP6U144_9ACTN|nr:MULTISPECIES: hypothetical protein [Streptomyces]MCG0062182.1 hypothetical protein [Streptomyces tricolor]GHC14060.1 hypothetical protein GCM10010332_50080 [Streptomyces albogriseolus]